MRNTETAEDVRTRRTWSAEEDYVDPVNEIAR